MKLNKKHGLVWFILPLIVGLPIVPLVVLYFEVFYAKNTVADSLAKIVHFQFAPDHGLFLAAILGLFPFALLATICWNSARRSTPAKLACLGIGGLIGILSFMIPTEIALWRPFYIGAQVSSTWAIALFFIPVWSSITLFIGLYAGWSVSTLPCWRIGAYKPR